MSIFAVSRIAGYVLGKYRGPRVSSHLRPEIVKGDLTVQLLLRAHRVKTTFITIYHVV